jgi:drug/metabolite transporter (DMT)-like permease
MSGNYALGVLFALLFGVMNAAGVILQKSAINRIHSRVKPGTNGNANITAQYVRDPVWIAGLLTSFGLGTAFNFLAVRQIGPALVPALATTDMIVLALGSAKILNERLKPAEWLGIIFLVIGIVCLSFSGLQIPSSEVNLLESTTQIRLAVFTLVLSVCCGLLWLTAKRIASGGKGLMLAGSSGILFALSNLWILPLLVTAGSVFSGTGRPAEIIIFILTAIILTVANMLAIGQTQESYRFAPASKVMPIQKVPQQIVPILIFLLVFVHPFIQVAFYLVPLGVTLILAAGFLLSKRSLDDSGKPAEQGSHA